MTDLIERMAQAMWQRRNEIVSQETMDNLPTPEWSAIGEHTRDFFRQMARAAMAPLRDLGTETYLVVAKAIHDNMINPQIPGIADPAVDDLRVGFHGSVRSFRSLHPYVRGAYGCGVAWGAINALVDKILKET